MFQAIVNKSTNPLIYLGCQTYWGGGAKKTNAYVIVCYKKNIIYAI